MRQPYYGEFGQVWVIWWKKVTRQLHGMKQSLSANMDGGFACESALERPQRGVAKHSERSSLCGWDQASPDIRSEQGDEPDNYQ
ncbi:hypothetical protein FOXB_07002 [Fusarium oxysporum f. sp. conglutinans Fo5176]|uniref:Uncharacterized protein n=1 Tax=Fusarium oxysporum (strain Fo5176) TaxID=660025 RepID=F9FKS3_FUSOF|nr:hypothetical protein FOXB_07002 [Fusarium oxysporum f. sp. conglutinans Fo5176]